MADVDDDVMELDGYLDLRCAKCGTRARVLHPTYAECWQVTKDWLFDSVAYWRGESSGRLVMFDDEPAPPDDDLLTAGDDDDLHPLGTMGWLQSAADDAAAGGMSPELANWLEANIAAEHERNQADDWQAPTNCTHIWFVTATYDDAGQAMAELQCTRCHEYARVSLTDDECETMVKGWEMGLCFEWDRNRHRVMMDRDVPRRPAVAELVNALDLFEGDDDENIPF